jgi:flagellar hook-associated protein 2
VSSPITLSGFNQVDFGQVLEALMQRERLPLAQLQSQKQVLETRRSAFAELATTLGALRQPVAALAGPSAFRSLSLASSDPSRLTAAMAGTAAAGRYDLRVERLARAQVTTSEEPSPYTSPDDIVADGGSLTIGGRRITLAGPTTLSGLAEAINAAPETGVSASLVRTGASVRLMFTGRETGAAAAFAVENALTLSTGRPIAFAAAPAQEAGDARVTVNGVTATSASNTFRGVVQGVEFTVAREDPASVVTLTITASAESVRSLVENMVGAFNELAAFIDAQVAATNGGDDAALGRDPLARGLRRMVAATLGARYGEGPVTSLAQVGVGFTRTGQLAFDAARFDAAMAADPAAVEQLFRGGEGGVGVFSQLDHLIEQYTDSGGLVASAQRRLDVQVAGLGQRMQDLERRLVDRRETLQREFTAADRAIAQINAAAGTLSALGAQFTLF